MIYLFEFASCGLFALSNDKTGVNVVRLDRNGFWLLRTELSSQVVRSQFADAMETCTDHAVSIPAIGLRVPAARSSIRLLQLGIAAD